MIDAKLQEARHRSAKRGLRIAIILSVIVCLCGLAVFGLSFIDFLEKSPVVVAVSEAEKQGEDDREKIRDKFKDILQYYENELEPRFLLIDIENYRPETFFELKEFKKRVMLEFSVGDYQAATNNLLTLQERTLTILDEAERDFQKNITAATSFLAKDLHDEARLSIEKALSVAPRSPEALALQQKIDKLPNILQLLDGARVARTENNPQKEYDYLQQVMRLAPERKDITDRLIVLGELIKKQQFDRHISRAFAAVEKDKVKEARLHYQAARKTDPDRAELKELSRQIAALEKSQRVQLALSEATQAIRRDDWQQAQYNFAKAVKDAPENTTAVEGLKRADAVLALLKRFNRFFSDPYRLTAPTVLREAEQALILAEDFSGFSFLVKKQANRLSELVTKLNRPIPVTVLSDNKTQVLVRRVGKLGAISEKTIELKPGKYTFEGSRNGYKSKLVQTFIRYEQESYRVQIICDERI